MFEFWHHFTCSFFSSQPMTERMSLFLHNVLCFRSRHSAFRNTVRSDRKLHPANVGELHGKLFFTKLVSNATGGARQRCHHTSSEAGLSARRNKWVQGSIRLHVYIVFSISTHICIHTEWKRYLQAGVCYKLNKSLDFPTLSNDSDASKMFLSCNKKRLIIRWH